MTTSAPQQYLRDAVMTARPEQLQLMLYDGAIRFARQGREAILAKNYEQVYDRLSRAQRIMIEMQNALSHDVSPQLCKQMAALYDFVYHKLVEAATRQSVEAVDDALRILDHQRETWVMLIDKVKAESQAAGDAGAAEPSPTPDPAALVAGSTLSIEG
jgi:flagellar protein FliS